MDFRQTVEIMLDRFQDQSAADQQDPDYSQRNGTEQSGITRHRAGFQKFEMDFICRVLTEFSVAE